MNVIIENSKGQEISLQQALTISEYVKKYEVDGILKKEEYFSDQSLASIVYYKNNLETDQQIISDLASGEATIIIRERVELPLHTLIKSSVYRHNGSLTMKFNSLLDQNNELICEEHIDLESNNPDYDQTIKYFYNRAIDPENEIFSGHYKKDGSLDYIKYDAYSFQDAIWFADDGTPGVDDIPTLCVYTGLSEIQVQYYLTATLLP